MPNEMTPREAAERLETIDRLVLIKGIGPEYDAMRDAVKYAASMLRQIAAGEYKQVVHGCWKRRPDGGNLYRNFFECSKCHLTEIFPAKPSKYCPNCGALMGKDDSHA